LPAAAQGRINKLFELKVILLHYGVISYRSLCPIVRPRWR
jgi:hypothetical protein